jgi:hypothetical protein
VVSLPPGASLTLTGTCPIPEKAPFRLMAIYNAGPEWAKRLNTWQGYLIPMSFMVNLMQKK